MLKNAPRGIRKQSGYAIVGIIAAVGIAATTLLVTTLSSAAIRNEQDRKTNAALALAKQALIGRAAGDANRPGSLPCPDVDNDGVLTLGVDYAGGGACTANIGRLPWRTLDLPDLRDGDGERLWYAVSPNFQDIATNVINSTTVGQLSVSAVTATNIAALVFAPGAALSGQQRGSAQQNTVANYLEAYNAADPLIFNSAGSTFNDKSVLVQASDIFAVVQKRIARETQTALDAYFAANGKYPFAASLSNPGCAVDGVSATCTSVQNLTTGFLPGRPDAVSGFNPYTAGSALLDAGSSDWFEANKWRSVLLYNVAPECATASPTCSTGTVTVTVTGLGGDQTLSNQKAVIVFSGVTTGTQNEQRKTTHMVGTP